MSVAKHIFICSTKSFSPIAIPKLNKIFEENISPCYLIPILSHIAGQTIIREKTLIVFDEIQLCDITHSGIPPTIRYWR